MSELNHLLVLARCAASLGCLNSTICSSSVCSLHLPESPMLGQCTHSYLVGYHSRTSPSVSSRGFSEQIPFQDWAPTSLPLTRSFPTSSALLHTQPLCLSSPNKLE